MYVINSRGIGPYDNREKDPIDYVGFYETMRRPNDCDRNYVVKRNFLTLVHQRGPVVFRIKSKSYIFGISFILL